MSIIEEIQNNLNEVENVKENIKTELENKGFNMAGVSFQQYPSIVSQIEGGGTNNYNELENKPSINGVTLKGNKSSAELGLISNEIDPTVPVWVKSITQQDITNWNNKATTGYVDQKTTEVTNYVNGLVGDINTALESILGV